MSDFRKMISWAILKTVLNSSRTNMSNVQAVCTKAAYFVGRRMLNGREHQTLRLNDA